MQFIKLLAETAGYGDILDDDQKLTIINAIALLAYMGGSTTLVKRLRKVWPVIKEEGKIPSDVTLIDTFMASKLVES